MNNKYFPEILKDKILLVIRLIYAVFLLIISIFLALSFYSFDIGDNSFLTSTSNATNNILGPGGSYTASFLLYTFGVMAYLFTLFFIIYSIQILLNRSLNEK